MKIKLLRNYNDLKKERTETLLENFYFVILEIEELETTPDKNNIKEFFMDAKERIKKELQDRYYFCDECKEHSFADVVDSACYELECWNCGNPTLTKIEVFKPGDVVCIIGYRSVDDLEMMELDDSLMEYLVESGLVAFKVIEFDEYRNLVKIEGCEDWYNASIFTKVSSN